MPDPGVPAQQSDFPELISNGRAGGGKPLITQWHAQRGMFTGFHYFEHGRIITQQFI